MSKRNRTNLIGLQGVFFFIVSVQNHALHAPLPEGYSLKRSEHSPPVSASAEKVSAFQEALMKVKTMLRREFEQVHNPDIPVPAIDLCLETDPRHQAVCRLEQTMESLQTLQKTTPPEQQWEKLIALVDREIIQAPDNFYTKFLIAYFVPGIGTANIPSLAQERWSIPASPSSLSTQPQAEAGLSFPISNGVQVGLRNLPHAGPSRSTTCRPLRLAHLRPTHIHSSQNLRRALMRRDATAQTFVCHLHPCAQRAALFRQLWGQPLPTLCIVDTDRDLCRDFAGELLTMLDTIAENQKGNRFSSTPRFPELTRTQPTTGSRTWRPTVKHLVQRKVQKMDIAFLFITTQGSGWEACRFQGANTSEEADEPHCHTAICKFFSGFSMPYDRSFCGLLA